MIDRKKIAERVDRILEEETAESLNKWLDEYRSKQCIWNTMGEGMHCSLDVLFNSYPADMIQTGNTFSTELLSKIPALLINKSILSTVTWSFKERIESLF